MRKFGKLFIGVSGLLASASLAQAADYGMPDMMRGSMNPSFGEYDDGLDFEFNVRHWYSMGSQDYDGGGLYAEETDTAHTAELGFRIDDNSTNTFLKGSIGASVLIEGEYDNSENTGDVNGGNITFAGADYGFYSFELGDKGNGLSGGFFAGYQFWQDSPDMDRSNFGVVGSVDDLNWSTVDGSFSYGVDSYEHELNIHAVRVGVESKVELADRFDLTLDAAIIPYAFVSGNLAGGPSVVSNSQSVVTTSPIEFEGAGFGAQLQAMLGFNVTENFTIRAGARAWGVQASGEAEYTSAVIVAPADSADVDDDFDIPPTVGTQRVVFDLDALTVFRWGSLIEFAYRF